MKSLFRLCSLLVLCALIVAVAPVHTVLAAPPKPFELKITEKAFAPVARAAVKGARSATVTIEEGKLTAHVAKGTVVYNFEMTVAAVDGKVVFSVNPKVQLTIKANTKLDQKTSNQWKTDIDNFTNGIAGSMDKYLKTKAGKNYIVQSVVLTNKTMVVTGTK